MSCCFKWLVIPDVVPVYFSVYEHSVQLTVSPAAFKVKHGQTNAVKGLFVRGFLSLILIFYNLHKFIQKKIENFLVKLFQSTELHAYMSKIRSNACIIYTYMCM